MNHRVFERTLRLLVFREARLSERQLNHFGSIQLPVLAAGGPTVGSPRLNLARGKPASEPQIVEFLLLRNLWLSHPLQSKPHLFDLRSDEDTR